MQSDDLKQKNANELYIEGMYNAVWVTGYVRNIDRDSRTFYLQQTNNLNHMLPITYDADHPLPDVVRETEAMHVTGNVIGYFKSETNERGVRVKAFSYEKPAADILVPDAAFNLALSEAIPTDEFRPQNGLEGTQNAGSNVVRIAGIVQAAFLTKKARPSLVLLIRQTENLDTAIPVRIYGAFAKPLKNRIKIGQAIHVEGQYRVKVKERPDLATGGEAYMPVDKTPYIHASNARVALPEEITQIPAWVKENGWLTHISGHGECLDQAVVEALRQERINSLSPEAAQFPSNGSAA